MVFGGWFVAEIVFRIIVNYQKKRRYPFEQLDR